MVVNLQKQSDYRRKYELGWCTLSLSFTCASAGNTKYFLLTGTQFVHASPDLKVGEKSC